MTSTATLTRPIAPRISSSDCVDTRTSTRLADASLEPRNSRVVWVQARFSSRSAHCLYLDLERRYPAASCWGCRRSLAEALGLVLRAAHIEGLPRSRGSMFAVPATVR